MSFRSEGARSPGSRSAARDLRLVVLAVCLAVGIAAGGSPARSALRICADPNNLPFSNRAGQGFENKIAQLVANDLHATLSYYWWPQRRGFVRNTIGADKCDLIIGVPADYGPVLATQSYYRSTYVFVSRADRHLALRSLDDPRLRQLRIGLHFTGGSANPPPGHALARRNIITNVVPYSIYGNYREANPPARLIDAVARGDVDVAVVWGPLAGYFAQHEPMRLDLVPVTPVVDGPGVSFAFDIAMGVAKSDTTLRTVVNRVLTRERASIDRILRAYGVPLLAPPGRAERESQYPAPAQPMADASSTTSIGGSRTVQRRGASE